MCDQLLFVKEQMMFGRNIPPEINLRMQQAVAAYEDTDRAEQLLWDAHKLNPEQLEVYIALYKFYFYKKRLAEAEKVAREALAVSARVGKFPADWQMLTRDSADWQQHDGPERVYLYTMKALGFIRLRLDDYQEGEAILNKLQILDPDDQVGGSVLLELASGLREIAHG
jgi:tetratricopeptide (TPR) repeat protein